MLFQGEHKCRFVSVLSLPTCACLSQGYTLAEEEEDPLIFQHRQLRGNQSDTLVSGPVEPGPMKKLHVSTTALQKVCRMTCNFRHNDSQVLPERFFHYLLQHHQLSIAQILNIHPWVDSTASSVLACLPFLNKTHKGAWMLIFVDIHILLNDKNILILKSYIYLISFVCLLVLFLLFAGMGCSQEGLQRWLAGVVKTSQCGLAKRIIFTCPALLLVSGTDIYTTR